MKNWVVYNKKKNIKEIVEKYNITPLTAVILCNRDINSFEEIDMILSNDIFKIHEAKLLPDIDKSCEILYNNILNKKRIRIVGDYDIDGICATFILYDAISKLGGLVSYVIPDRKFDGYGINLRIIDEAIKDKIDLIITCDNGISADKQIAYAKENNISVIVTDHHDISTIPKMADAIVNPKRNDIKNDYPFKEICGAVVAFKFIIRFLEIYDGKFKINKIDAIDSYIEFAMIATIGDIMPLTNENHIIAKIGLKKLPDTKNRSLKKLLELSEIDYVNNEIRPYHIGFIIGPLINAAGRMESAEIAIKLFTSNDENEINEKATYLKKLNDDRKKMTELGVKTAFEIIEKDYSNDKVLVVFLDNVEEQVAGIVAGRVKEKYNKPVIILTNTYDENEAKASCRSIEAYNIFEALNLHKEMFLKFGGHKLAAGFSMLKKDVESLRKLLNEESKLTEKDFIKKVYVDAIFPLNEITENIINDIAKLEPYGNKFNQPYFGTKDVGVSILNIYGNEKNVIKLNLAQNKKVGRGVLFEDSEKFIEVLDNKNKSLDIIYYPTINEYKGFRNIEITVIDYI